MPRKTEVGTIKKTKQAAVLLQLIVRIIILPVAPVAQRYHVTSDTLGREFDPGKRDFSH